MTQLPKHESKDEENYFINTIRRNEHTRDVLKEIFLLSVGGCCFKTHYSFIEIFFIISLKERLWNGKVIFYETLQYANTANFFCILEIHEILKVNITQTRKYIRNLFFINPRQFKKKSRCLFLVILSSTRIRTI